VTRKKRAVPGRPPKVPTARGYELLTEVDRIAAEMELVEAELEDLRRQRRRLWVEALDQGLTSRRLAELAGLGTTTVERELARAREEALA